MPTNINPYTGSIEFKGVDYIISDSDPTAATYDGFNVPTISTTKVTGHAYLLTLKDETTKTATWIPLAIGPTDFENIIPDTGTNPVVPSAAGSIAFAGANGVVATGGLNTLTIGLPRIVAGVGTDFAILMGDAVGTNRISFRNSADVQLAWIDSLANFAGESFDAVAFIESPLYQVAAGADIAIRMGDAVGANFINFQSSTPGTVSSLSSTGILDVVNITAGTFAARETVYAPFEEAIITTVGDDNTVSGVSSRKAVYGGIFPTAGDGNSSPQAIVGVGATAAGSHILSLSGCHGEVAQNNTSQVVSSLFGVTGLTSTDEVNAGDLPQLYFFGVHGNIYMDGGAATPTAGEYAGLGAITDYSTPLNSYAYGVVATRRGIGGGAAARAAFGVAQGTVAIPDWLYGLDLYNTTPTTAGQAYTTADIRLWNQSTITSSATETTFTTIAGTDIDVVMGAIDETTFINYKDSNLNTVATLTASGKFAANRVGTSSATAAVALESTQLKAHGTDANIDITILPKGTGSIAAPAATDINFKLGDAIGANAINFKEFSGTTVAYINSSGTLYTSGVHVFGDIAGIASNVTLTSVVDETLSSGVGSVLMTTVNAQNSSGWLKIYVGTEVRYIPYWTTIAP